MSIFHRKRWNDESLQDSTSQRHEIERRKRGVGKMVILHKGVVTLHKLYMIQKKTTALHQDCTGSLLSARLRSRIVK